LQKGSKTGAAPALASHLIELADGWGLWRAICLRGTGFPVSLLDPFGASEAAAAVDALMAAEAARSAAHAQAMALCRERRDRATDGARKVWQRALWRLLSDRSPKISAETESLAPMLERLTGATQEIVTARESADRAIAAARDQESLALCRIVEIPEFRQAIVWQNRAILRDTLDRLVASRKEKRNSRLRARERLVLIYLQRYTVRNESIGFFGPVAWGDFADAGPALVLHPGAELLAERLVEFEPWAIRAIVAALSREPRLRPWLAPRINPLMRLADGALIDAAGRLHPLSPSVSRLLSNCDGEAAAHEIASRLLAEPGTGFANSKAVFSALSQLAQRNVLIWRLDIPAGPCPERAAARQLARVGDPALRRSLEAKLEECVAARDRLGAAAGNAEALDRAFGDLETCFTKVTGASMADRRGKRPVGRALAYEDCRRDIEFSFGPDVAARLGPPLSLILAGARWFTDTAVARVMAEISDLFVRHRREAGTTVVDFAAFWLRVAKKGVISDANLAPVAAELQARWAKILPLDSAERRVDLRAASLAPIVADAFKSGPLAVPRILHHSPDVMIAAKSAEAICRGEYRFVLGEVHAGYATQLQPIFLRMHPRPKELVAGWEHDIAPRSFVFPTLPGSERRTRYSDSARVFELACNEGRPRRARGDVIALADLVAEDAADGLIVRTRDGAHRFHILDVLAFVLVDWSTRCFHMFPPAPHSPRIAVDDLVVRRETWQFPAGDVTFAGEKTDAGRFIEARRWACAFDLPRRVFVRFPGEPKPVYADLESPAFVDLAAHLWRTAAQREPKSLVTVTEMLPGPGECWLVDAQGQRYTSELRVVAVDRSPPPPAG